MADCYTTVSSNVGVAGDAWSKHHGDIRLQSQQIAAPMVAPDDDLLQASKMLIDTWAATGEDGNLLGRLRSIFVTGAYTQTERAELDQYLNNAIFLLKRKAARGSINLLLMDHSVSRIYQSASDIETLHGHFDGTEAAQDFGYAQIKAEGTTVTYSSAGYATAGYEPLARKYNK